MMVASIYMTKEEGEDVKRGDEVGSSPAFLLGTLRADRLLVQLGYFAFGGSTIVVLFKPNTVKFDEDLLANSRNSVRFGLNVLRYLDAQAHECLSLSRSRHSSAWAQGSDVLWTDVTENGGWTPPFSRRPVRNAQKVGTQLNTQTASQTLCSRLVSSKSSGTLEPFFPGSRARCVRWGSAL